MTGHDLVGQYPGRDRASTVPAQSAGSIVDNGYDEAITSEPSEEPGESSRRRNASSFRPQ